MLRSPKKLVLIQPQPTHVDIFVELYAQLKGWALQFTEHDHELAEDLLHDAFIQFTLSKPDLNSIQNLEGFLYIVMRNLHLSQMRRASRTPFRSFAVVEYDTVDMSFWASDPRDRIRMRDELGAVCQYACIRKESAKAGSVLILRFFHGYYPEEIARILLSNALAVNKRLQLARAEAKLYLENPDRLSFMGDKQSISIEKLNIDHFGEDLRLELRRHIFASRQGECIPEEELRELYESEAAKGIDHGTAAHIVSCQICIENVNSMLGLSPLATRYPLDTIGNDPGKKGGSGGGGGAGGGSGGGQKMLDSYLRRRDALFHHQPQELCIAVNGQLQTFQKVVSGKGDLTLIIDADESIGFVEVFSELGIRLLMLNVEPPPAGDGKQSTQIELSSGRTLEAKLNFGGRLPALHVSYNDPLLATEIALETTDAPDMAVRLEQPAYVAPRKNKPNITSFFAALRAWLQPARITAAFALILISVIGFLYVTGPVEKPLTAENLLANAARREAEIAANASLAVHRTYRVEEYSNGNLVAGRRVDDWQKVDASARRVFDEKEKMIAGAWHGSQGGAHVFKLGEKLKHVTPEYLASKAIADIEPTAEQFSELIENAGVSSELKLEQVENINTLTYRKGNDIQTRDGNNLPGELLLASLVLDRANLQPKSEMLILRIGDETKEYRFTDIRVEQKPVETVSPLIFLPEAELLRGSTNVVKPVEIEPVDTVANTSSNTTVLTSATATLETEVEVFKVLDSINALSGEQITVTRTTTGQLKIAGIVETIQRKAELVEALAPLRTGHGILVEIETREEAAARQRKAQATSNTVVESVNIATDQSYPVEQELRSALTKSGVSPENMDPEMRRFATAVTASSRSLRRNALALKQIAERFTPAEVELLDPAKREEWKALVRSRARAVSGDLRNLASQLSSVFPGSEVAGSGRADVKNDAATTAQRLFRLAAACDSQVNQSFAVTTDGKASGPVRSDQFWRSLAEISSIAAQLQKF